MCERYDGERKKEVHERDGGFTNSKFEQKKRKIGKKQNAIERINY